MTAILSLALGAGRMAHLVLKDKAGNDRFTGLTGPQTRQVRKASCIESVLGVDEWNLTTTDEDLPEDVVAVYLTPNASTHFGVPALMGRGLIPSDAPDGQDPQRVVVVTYKFWQRHYNASPDVLGRTLQLVHKSYTIVGVARPRFTWGDADVYLPLKLSQDPTVNYGAPLKLKAGVSHAAANAELQALLVQFAKETPTHFPASFHVAIKGLNDRFVDELGHTLFLLFGAVALLLASRCANVSILLLARGTVRQHELAVRAAMGAARAAEAGNIAANPGAPRLR